jgi:hypothetical protein
MNDAIKGREDGTMEHELHKFEKAGLGKAPFRITGHEEKRGPIDLGGGMTIGSPGQPMGTCDFCGTGIVDCFRIASSDGKTFVVGSVCVNKTGDAGLIKIVRTEVSRKRTAQRHAREAEKIVVLKAKLADPIIREALSSVEHPNHWRRAEGDTLLDWAEWMMANAGNSGKMTVLRALSMRGL